MGESYKPPASAIAAAKKGLAQRKEWGRGGLSPSEAKSQGIDSGVTRARKIASGSVSRHDVRRMSAFNRHRKNNRPDKKMPDGGPTAGTIAWNLWGGTSGVNWAKKKSAAMNAETFEEDHYYDLIWDIPPRHRGEDYDAYYKHVENRSMSFEDIKDYLIKNKNKITPKLDKSPSNESNECSQCSEVMATYCPQCHESYCKDCDEEYGHWFDIRLKGQSGYGDEKSEIILKDVCWDNFEYGIFNNSPLSKGAETFDAEEKLSKTSCCCGADESDPCACMKAPEPMSCRAKEPKCACYKALEKSAEGEAPQYYGDCGDCKQPIMLGIEIKDRYGVPSSFTPAISCQECDGVVCGSCHPKVCPLCEESYNAETLDYNSFTNDMEALLAKYSQMLLHYDSEYQSKARGGDGVMKLSMSFIPFDAYFDDVDFDAESASDPEIPEIISYQKNKYSMDLVVEYRGRKHDLELMIYQGYDAEDYAFPCEYCGQGGGYGLRQINLTNIRLDDGDAGYKIDICDPCLEKWESGVLFDPEGPRSADAYVAGDRWDAESLYDSYDSLYAFIKEFSEMGNDYVSDKGAEYLRNHLTIYHAESFGPVDEGGQLAKALAAVREKSKRYAPTPLRLTKLPHPDQKTLYDKYEADVITSHRPYPDVWSGNGWHRTSNFCWKCGDTGHHYSRCNSQKYTDALSRKKDMLKSVNAAINSHSWSDSDVEDLKELRRMIKNNHFGIARHYFNSLDTVLRDNIGYETEISFEADWRDLSRDSSGRWLPAGDDSTVSYDMTDMSWMTPSEYYQYVLEEPLDISDDIEDDTQTIEFQDRFVRYTAMTMSPQVIDALIEENELEIVSDLFADPAEAEGEIAFLKAVKRYQQFSEEYSAE